MLAGSDLQPLNGPGTRDPVHFTGIDFLGQVHHRSRVIGTLPLAYERPDVVQAGLREHDSVICFAEDYRASFIARCRACRYTVGHIVQSQ